MPLDAICLRAVVAELRETVCGLRIEKLYQPSRDRILLGLRGGLRLLLDGSANHARVHLTRFSCDNPPDPPMFCMLLRKHLIGKRILSVTQPDCERVVLLTVEGCDETGEIGRRTLVLEILGRFANLLLLDGENRIIDCLRRIGLDASAARPLLPGLAYRLPPPQEKQSPFAEESAALADHLPPDRKADDFLCSSLLGISPLIARELAVRAAGKQRDEPFSVWSAEQRDALRNLLTQWRGFGSERPFVPTLLLRNGEPFDFTYCPIIQYGAAVPSERRESFSALLDEYYGERERLELFRQRGKELRKRVRSAQERLSRKLAALNTELRDAQNRDTYRLYGELITANFHRVRKGQSILEAENYYREDGAAERIPLDPLLSPQQNAARYYKRYTKAKTAESYLTAQIEKAEAEQTYLASVMQELDDSETNMEEVRRELEESGYLRQSRQKRKKNPPPSMPRTFFSPAGLRISVGRSNLQNDRLTTKLADRRDLWFHVQKLHGSHVVLHTGGAEPAPEDVTAAALLAAWFSQARAGENVPVDYTAVRFVKKPAAARPGMVVYDKYRTIYVTPSEETVQKLGGK